VDEQGRRGAIRGGIVESASANFLDVAGMRPSLGRWFSAEGERRGDPVVAPGWGAWKRDFGANPKVPGQTLIVGGRPFEVIGVGPEKLNSAQSDALAANFWIPLGRGEPENMVEQRKNLSLLVRARLRDGVTVEQAQASLDVTARRLAADYPGADPGRGITVLPTDDVRIHPREKRLKPPPWRGCASWGWYWPSRAATWRHCCW
jgi:hypothetical protein